MCIRGFSARNARSETLSPGRWISHEFVSRYNTRIFPPTNFSHVAFEPTPSPMGLLSLGTPLSWTDTKKLADHIRSHGITQFLHTWDRLKDRRGDELFWGDEVPPFGSTSMFIC